MNRAGIDQFRRGGWSRNIRTVVSSGLWAPPRRKASTTARLAIAKGVQRSRGNPMAGR
jgi:hypothetical protein